MFDEIFEGNPIQKWQEIIHHANPSVVNQELERILGELAKSEIGKDGKNPTIEEIERIKNNLAIESMGNILSHNE